MKSLTKEEEFYVPPTGFSAKQVKKLHLNENLYGPAPECLDFLKRVDLEQLFEYSNQGNKFLADSIADYHGLFSDRIFVNQGAAAVLSQIFQFALSGNEPSVLLPDPHWAYYSSLANLYNAKIHKSKLVEKGNTFSYDIESFLKYFESEINVKLIVINSPHMPTGCSIKYEQVSEIASKFPESIIIIDEAYFGFEENQVDFVGLLEEYKNIVIVRTFSKLFALAGCRIGYAISSPEFVESIKTLGPLFGISGLSQKLASLALDNTEYYNQIARRIIKSRELLTDEIKKNTSFLCYDSFSNFLLINTDTFDPMEISSQFEDYGYIIRNCIGYGLKNHLRVTIGTESEVEFVIEKFKQYWPKV